MGESKVRMKTTIANLLSSITRTRGLRLAGSFPFFDGVIGSSSSSSSSSYGDSISSSSFSGASPRNIELYVSARFERKGIRFREHFIVQEAGGLAILTRSHLSS